MGSMSIMFSVVTYNVVPKDNDSPIEILVARPDGGEDRLPRKRLHSPDLSFDCHFSKTFPTNQDRTHDPSMTSAKRPTFFLGSGNNK